MDLLPTTRRIFKQGHRSAICSNRRRNTEPLLQFRRRNSRV